MEPALSLSKGRTLPSTSSGQALSDAFDSVPLSGRRPAAQPGLLVYILVDSVAVNAVVAKGGEIVQPIGADAPRSPPASAIPPET